MPTSKKQKRMTVTESEDAVIGLLKTKLDLPSESDVLREGLRLLCEMHGIEYPDDMPTWGGKRD